jgi:opacity protein-like surface antigen
MKKTFTAVLLLAAFALVTAQKKGKLEMGFNTGVNVSHVSDDYSQSESHIGFNLTASADYYFSNSWSMKLRLIYDQKGWDDDLIYDIQTGEGFNTNYKLDYITIPLVASWHFAPKRNFYLQFGPYVGFLASAKDSRFGEDVKENFETTDMGVTVGIGVKIPLNEKFRLFFEYDVQAGLTDIIKNNELSPVNTGRYSLNVGVNFLAN